MMRNVNAIGNPLPTAQPAMREYRSWPAALGHWPTGESRSGVRFPVTPTLSSVSAEEGERDADGDTRLEIRFECSQNFEIELMRP